MAITITEALAEIKTIGKRIDTKHAFIKQHLLRPDVMKDPFEKQGGTQAAEVAQTLQGIKDLGNRVIQLRAAIAHANATTSITVNETTHTIADWLTWRREVGPQLQAIYTGMSRAIAGARDDSTKRSWSAVGGQGPAPSLMVNVDEGDLGAQLETLQVVFGDLDGQLQLKNATVVLDV